MGNVSAPFGFVQRQGTGASPTYEFASGFNNGSIAYNASAIYYGDPVTRASSSSGTLIQAVGSAGNSTITMAGIFYGCKYLSTAQKRTVWSNYWPGSDVASTAQSTIESYVVNDPNAQFLVQSDSTGLAQATAIGAQFDFAIGTGTTANGLSGAYLLHTPGSNASWPFRCVDLVFDPPGANGTIQGANVSTASPYNYAIVAFNNVETRVTTTYNG